MEDKIIEWLKAVVKMDDERTEYIEKKKAAMRSEGFRFVTWTGGGNSDENRFLDQETRETLTVVEDTLEEYDRVWSENPDWHSDEGIMIEAHEIFEWPEVPAEYAVFLNEDIEPEDAREFLEGRGL